MTEEEEEEQQEHENKRIRPRERALGQKIEKLSLALLKSHGQSECPNPDRAELCQKSKNCHKPPFLPKTKVLNVTYFELT